MIGAGNRYTGHLKWFEGAACHEQPSWWSLGGDARLVRASIHYARPNILHGGLDGSQHSHHYQRNDEQHHHDQVNGQQDLSQARELQHDRGTQWSHISIILILEKLCSTYSRILFPLRTHWAPRRRHVVHGERGDPLPVLPFASTARDLYPQEDLIKRFGRKSSSGKCMANG